MRIGLWALIPAALMIGIGTISVNWALLIWTFDATRIYRNTTVELAVVGWILLVFGFALAIKAAKNYQDEVKRFTNESVPSYL